MRRLPIAVLFVATPAIAVNVALHMSPQSPSAVSSEYADIIYWLNFENGSTFTYSLGSSECSDGSSTVTASGDGFIDTSSALIGSNAFSGVNAGDWAQASVSSNDIWPTSGTIGFWMNIDTWSSNAYVFYAGNSDKFGLRLSGSDELNVFVYTSSDGVRQATTLNANLSADTDYFVQVSWDVASNDIDFFINGSAESNSNSGTLGNMEDITGIYLFGGGGAYPDLGYSLIDNIMISDDPSRDFYDSSLYDDTAAPTGACDG